MRYIGIMMSLIMTLAVGSISLAQETTGQLAAVLEVITGDVDVQRVSTVNRLPVSVEAVVGVGDTIFTGENGRARITYFENGVSTEILSNTTYRIDRFEGDITGDTFNIEVSVLLGQTVQQLQRLLNTGSSYEINTPGMTLAARGTMFGVRVEDTGRAAMIVSEGMVDADSGNSSADVPEGFGVRAVSEEGLSEVVRATTFEQLDAALDGCDISIETPDDVSLNVRTGPAIDRDLITYISADNIRNAVGTNASGSWYRIAYDEGFGWVLATVANVSENCAGLRIFPDTYTEGDVLSPDAIPEVPESETTDDTSSS